jgi:hypothetical protein
MLASNCACSSRIFINNSFDLLMYVVYKVCDMFGKLGL